MTDPVNTLKDKVIVIGGAAKNLGGLISRDLVLANGVDTTR